ncbi:OmpW family outer membrane protein [Acinetobacter baumannii]|uniref:OmpW/AlkL family protein n=1 Tax=Acinetobacter baumannii TaxID=470 RepID=UPI002147F49F|nr:OmpW family outer membrane protein [Acinetobacter baumannii]MCR0008033.1 outer membrane beta-barrel protein [Acinetobacter baumannii]MDC4798184.1 outer membrane beta-barrel protein [Acinetobacter baumannii]MDC5138288.1 outer membrane beta-barrel protein [Acinetobacter baumannii]MDC5538224.1 outer membrane beta-barrel protein [Acinetobacter baumannii]MDH2627699.1 OmpW family outer membrane protein [Acinetobacter baumannii]
MMKKSLFCMTAALFALPTVTSAASPYFSLKDGDGFKRFSVSAGWLHAMPQGSGNPVNINTSVAEGTKSKVGDVTVDSVLGAIDQSTADGKRKHDTLKTLTDNPLTSLLITHKGEDGKTYLNSNIAGEATINGLSNWEAQGTGLEADNVDTVGIMANYHFSDNLSLEIKAGIPPKVDIKGKGNIYAPLSGIDKPGGIGAILGDIPLKQDIFITDLTQSSKAASARAWLPAVELHYQFGKSGVNKFRPYVGAGVMYAYFNELEMNSGIESDLIKAGHMIQNIHDGKAGAALDGKTSSAKPIVKLEATDTFAPIVTLGATYDFNPNWFAVGSVSYSKMNSEAKIYVTDQNTGKELIKANTKIDIDPLITYLGVGYRF